MDRAARAMMSSGGLCLSVAALGLGALGFATGDFALNWQPVPEWVPGRVMLAHLTAALFATLGAGVLIGRYKSYCALGLAAAFLLWALLLHGPAVLAAPLKILPWLGFTEPLAVAAGALMFAIAQPTGVALSRWRTLARIAFGACLPIFGLSHLAYPDFTAGMIPAWMPAPVFWAYFTGAGHLAAGVSILTGVLARVGSFLFAVMVSLFVLFLHVPGVISHSGDRREWTMLVIAMTIAAAAWCVAGSLASGRSLASK